MRKGKKFYRSGRKRVKRGGARAYFYSVGQRVQRGSLSPIGGSEVPGWAHAACLLGHAHQRGMGKELRRYRHERSRL